MRRPRALTPLLAFALLATLAASPPAVADPVPADATWTQEWFPSQDGTLLRADVFLPKNRQPTDRHPVILSIGPYFGRNPLNHGVRENGPVLRFNDLIVGGKIFERGYAWVQVDSRGFGGSQGCNDFGGPGEQMDAEAAVNWAAKQSWSNGRVGMWGKSYDAWTQVMALSENPVGLKAAVIQAPLIETYRGMFMNGVHWDAGWYATPSLYAAYDLAPNVAGDSRPEEFLYPALGTATNPHCYAENIAMTTQYDHDLPYWQKRDIVDAAGRSDVPVLWSHGANDVNTKPSNFLDVYSRLEGPKRVWFGQWAHDRGNEVNKVGRDGFLAEAMDWFDHYLKGLPLVEHPGAEIQDQEGKWRREASWPPADAQPHSFPVKPGTYSDDGDNDADGGGNGTWTFTPPAPYDLRFAGEPRLQVTVDTQVPNANLLGILYDVAPNGNARLLSRGAYLLESEGQVAFNLFPQDTILRQGHRLGLLLSGSDDDLFNAIPTNTDVQVTAGSLTLAFLQYARTPDLVGKAATAMASVPETTVSSGTISANEVQADYPPAPEPPPCPEFPDPCPAG